MPKGDADDLRADLDDGYAKVANLVLEALACAPLTKTQYAVVLCIMRQTYGWAKARDRRTGKMAMMTAEHIAAGTAKPVESVRKAIQSLVKAHVILSTEVKAGNYYAYGINPAVSEWGMVTVEWKEAKVTLMEAREDGTYGKKPPEVWSKLTRGMVENDHPIGEKPPEVPTPTPTPAEPPEAPTDINDVTDSSTDNTTDNDNTLAASAAGSGADEPETEAEQPTLIEVPPENKPRVETDVQRVIRECWEMLDLGDMPKGKLTGYSRLAKLFTSTNLTVIEQRLKTAIATKPELPVPPAQPWPWFVEFFAGAVNRPWEYEQKQSSGGTQSPADAYTRGSTKVGDFDNEPTGEINLAQMRGER